MTRPPALASLVVLVLVLATAGRPVFAAGTAHPEQGPAWATLSPQQQAVLGPLQPEWSALPSSRKQKWIEMARRFPSLPAPERERIQQRMAAWAGMSAAERTRARLQFLESREFSAEDREARWEAYKALPDAERRELARRARPTAKVAGPHASGAEAHAAGAKHNHVGPSRHPPVKPVAPTLVQANPGASTSLMTARPAPVTQAQSGLPKIAATRGFVDPRTLLPLLGPQGAAMIGTTPAAPSEDVHR
ncbi:MAG: DUF3106 domain-containing protein [Burkholderiales bacterium]|nr:DUF3106 domain-containing protein [Burkholderiales bacterium]